MEKLKVQLNGKSFYFKTDHPDEVLEYARELEKKIQQIKVQMKMNDTDATALSALLILGESLSRGRSEDDEALIEELNGKIEVLEERVDTLAREIAAHNDAESAFRTEITGLRERERTLLERITEINLREQELTTAYEDSRTALEDTQSALTSANKIIDQLNTEKFTEVAANEALRNELEASQGRLETANKLIAELNGKLTKLEINNISVTDGKISEVDEELKKVKSEKEDLEIELAIAREEIEKLKSAGTQEDESEQAKKIAEYEKQIKQLEGRSAEIDKLRSILAETEHSVRHKVDEKESENTKLRAILKNYENSYAVCVGKKEEEILALQQEVERLKERLKISDDESAGGSYVQTTLDDGGSDEGEEADRVDDNADDAGNADEE